MHLSEKLETLKKSNIPSRLLSYEKKKTIILWILAGHECLQK